MRKIIKNIFLLIVFILVLPLLVRSVSAASLKFDKTTTTISNGDTFQIAVTVDPGSDALRSAEAYVIFDSSLLKATAVSAGSLFSTVSHDEETTGRVYIAGMIDDPASSISTAGTLATITFQALKDGSGALSFNCDSSKAVKNDINFSNVLTCSQNGTAAVTVGGGGSTSNPTPTTTSTTGSSSSNTNNNSPTTLPQSGIFDNVIKFVIPGMILLMLGSILKFIF
jgi:hypothetical protein